MTGYATRDVSELIGFKADQIRHYVRRGLLSPQRGEHGEYLFSFQDVVLLRTAKGLLDSQVTPRRAYRVLLKLKAELAAVKSLSAVRIFADGNNVVVREDSSVWNAESGQGHLNFSVSELEGTVAALARTKATDPTPAESELDSDDWYNLGLDLEEVDPERAPEAYLRAIALDPKNADAHVNVGRLYQMKGQLKAARRYYRKALECVPDHQLALYNLGTLFDELAELDTAAEYYRRALRIPDAHYNLARICEIRGDELAALRHLRRYQQLLETTE
jgi:tetratricopeptide (TPR) repeat protein